MNKEDKLKLYKICGEMLRLFKDDNASARLLLSRDFEDRLHELGIRRYCESYVKLSMDELNSYIERLDDIEELSSIFYSRWYHIKNCGMADDIEKREVRDWFIYVLQRMEELMNDDIACFRGNDVISLKIASVKNRMKQVVELALTAAKYDSRVLIEGETGVGKEIIAKLIYRNGVRKNGPFIAVNCSAIPETLIESELFGYEKGSFTGADEKGKKGYFELANKGVIFLDEIGEISLSFQSKLLRTLQENEILRIGGKQSRKIDVQVIAATNKNLAEKVQTGEFKADLFYRLNTFPIMIPPLRERQADIVPLIYSFADKFNKKYGTQKRFSLSSLNALQVYEWPGNVREVENIVERLVLTVHDDVINAEHVGMILGTCKKDFNGAGERGTLREVSEHAEKELIKKYMEIYDNPEDLEKALDVSRATLNRKLLKYDLR